MLTAAHCTDGATSIFVYAGEHNTQVYEGEQYIEASDFIIHPKYYGNGNYGYDFSIIRLKTPIDLNQNQNVGLVCLNQDINKSFVGK